MESKASSPGSRAFGPQSDRGLVVAYQSHQDALRFLAAALAGPNRMGLLQGPVGSGKTTVLQQLSASVDAAVAVIDAGDLQPRRLLTDLLAQFEVTVVSQQDEQFLQAIANFVSREARNGRAPLLVVDNADSASPSVQSLLNWLAAIETGGRYALGMVLAGRERMAELTRRSSLRDVGRRHPATWSMNPLSAYETRVYLRTRLVAAGGDSADKIFPNELCERLHTLSEGWPGALNRQALAVTERLEELEAAKPVPRIIVTRDGETVGQYELRRPKYVIGRSDLADIIIEDGYTSKLHAMLQVYANAVLLSDLNSTNGTLVNSKEVRNTVLRNNDIIMLGRHRLKIEGLPALSSEVDERLRAADTQTLKHLPDLRKRRARRTIAALKHYDSA
jgi:type II secretory pathway predicted ATPase ExeA